MLFTVETPSKKPDMERCMSEYGDSLLRLCYLYLKDYQLAQDALQETFIRVYTKYHTFRGDSSEKTWITRIAVNTCKSMMRKRSFRDELPASEEMPEPVASAPSLEESAVERERDRILYNAVCAMDPIYKEVILLFYYSELHITEIAGILGTREGTVKTRLMRARMHLGKILKEDLS